MSVTGQNIELYCPGTILVEAAVKASSEEVFWASIQSFCAGELFFIVVLGS